MRHLASSATALVTALGAAFLGCNAQPPAPKPPVAAAVQPASAPPSCAATTGVAGPVALDKARIGSAVVLGKLGGKTLAYVADEDEQAIHVVDVDSGKPVAKVDLDGRPSQAILLADGRLVVALRDKAKLQILATTDANGALAKRCTVPTSAEPVALALTPDDATVLVTSGWGRKLGAYDTNELARRWEAPLDREPRAVTVTDDGKRAFVAHAVGGDLSIVDLQAAERTVRKVALHGDDPESSRAQLATEMKKVRDMNDVKARAKLMQRNMGLNRSTRASCQGFALAKSIDPGGRILAPQVLVEPGDPRQRPTGYGADNDQTEFPDVAVVDGATGDALAVSLEKTDHRQMAMMRGDPREHSHEECLLPRAAAYDAATRSLFVTCFGIDQVIAYDAAAANPARAEKQRWDVAAGPSGIAIDPAGRRAIVWSQHDRTLNRVPLDALDTPAAKGAAVARFDLPSDPAQRIPMGVALGRLLFHEVGDARMSHDGRACASCHPDGRDDALVWATPEGPRRSIMLAGRVVSTAPYSWSGTEATLKEHLDITFDRLKGHGGLKSLELDALAQYVSSLSPPPGHGEGGDPRAARGKEIFASTDAGCSTCHAGVDGTDNQRHDVKSKTAPDKSGDFNTPSLRFVGGTGPYFHDGRYKTLAELLKDSDGKMGKTGHLSPDDLGALEAYLRTL